MEEQKLFEEPSGDMDPFDREERCRKAIRTLRKAVAMRVVAGVLLAVVVVRAGSAPVALGLTAFALLVILTGLLPLARELKKQKALLKEALQAQETQK
ncbi:MAG: hypothetical protein SOW84_02875 [Candidatus Faecousia sp.]|nr:hypothetical protein [Candidatus Faecousia sp.]